METVRSWFQGTLELARSALRARGEDYILVPLDEQNGVSEISRVVKRDEDYVTLTIKSSRVVNVRVLSAKFYGCLQSRAHYLHQNLGRVEFQTVIVPPLLQKIDKAHLDRVVVVDKEILGPVPYRGELSLELGLFSVEAVDLAGDYIELLTTLANQSGVSWVKAASAFVEPLRKGAEMLFGNRNQSILEIGTDRSWRDDGLKTGIWLLMRAPKGAVNIQDLRLDQSDFRLTDNSGKAFGEYPYVIFSINASRERSDWMLIPELKEAWDAVGAASRKAKLDDAEQLLKQFALIAEWSPDLVPADAQRLATKVRKKLPELQPREGVSYRGQQSLGDLEGLDLYGQNATI